MARLLKTLVLAAIAYALWQYLKTVLSEPEPEPVGTAPVAPAPERPASSNGGGSARSKAELYEEAQRLGIKGRSKMSKADLERAIRDAG